MLLVLSSELEEPCRIGVGRVSRRDSTATSRNRADDMYTQADNLDVLTSREHRRSCCDRARRNLVAGGRNTVFRRGPKRFGATEERELPRDMEYSRANSIRG